MSEFEKQRQAQTSTQSAAEEHQSAQETGAATAQSKEANAEEKRAAAAEQEWTSFLGKKLGAKAFEKIHELVSYESLLGYAKDGTKAMGDALKDGVFKPTEEGVAGGAMDEASEAAALNALVAALSPEIVKLADKWLEGPQGQRVLTAVGNWTEEHPRTVTAIIGTLLIGGAVAAYVANMKIPELKQSFKLGKGFEVEAGVKLGKLQEIAFEAATVGVKYETEGLSASLKGTYDKEGKSSATASVSGTGQIGGRTTTEGKAEATWKESGELELKASAGLETFLQSTPLSLGVDASHSSGGETGSTRFGGNIKLGEQGEQRILGGYYDAQTDAFRISIGQTAMGGAFSHETATGRDDEGKGYGEEKLSLKQDELSLSYASRDTEGGGHSDRFSLGYAGEQFKSELDYAMDESVHTLGLKSSAALGDEYTVGLNLDYNLNESRLDTYGASFGWKDAEEWRAFRLDYKAKWLQDNQGYEHGFDVAFENSVGNLSTRLRAGVDLQGGPQGSQVTGANADLLAGYRVNEDWAVLGGANVGMERNMGGGMDPQWGVRTGVQYKDVAFTVGYTPDSDRGTVTFGIEIPLGWGR